MLFHLVTKQADATYAEGMIQFGQADCSINETCGSVFTDDGDMDGIDLATFAHEFGRTDCP